MTLYIEVFGSLGGHKMVIILFIFQFLYFNPPKQQKLEEKVPAKLDFKKNKNTALYLLHITQQMQGTVLVFSIPPMFHSRVVFLHVFIPALFLYLLQVHPYLKSSLEEPFPPSFKWGWTCKKYRNKAENYPTFVCSKYRLVFLSFFSIIIPQ